MTDTMVISDVALADIVAGDNDRTTFDEDALRELADSIEANGLAQPITIRPTGLGLNFEVVCGERRLRACRLLGWETMQCIIRELDDAEAADIMLTENLARVDLSPLQEANAYRKRMDQGATLERLSAATGVPFTRIQSRLDLLEIVDEAQRLTDCKILPLGHAAQLVGLDSDRQYLALAGWNREGLTQAAFTALCERLRHEQNTQPMFDTATFLQMEEYALTAKAQGVSPARRLKDLAYRMAAELTEAGLAPELVDELGSLV